MTGTFKLHWDMGLSSHVKPTQILKKKHCYLEVENILNQYNILLEMPIHNIFCSHIYHKIMIRESCVETKSVVRL